MRDDKEIVYDDDIEKCIEILELAIYDVVPHIPAQVIERVICYLKDYDKLKYEQGWDVPEYKGVFYY